VSKEKILPKKQSVCCTAEPTFVKLLKWVLDCILLINNYCRIFCFVLFLKYQDIRPFWTSDWLLPIFGFSTVSNIIHEILTLYYQVQSRIATQCANVGNTGKRVTNWETERQVMLFRPDTLSLNGLLRKTDRNSCVMAERMWTMGRRIALKKI
jgi:hypothetical protein